MRLPRLPRTRKYASLFVLLAAFIVKVPMVRAQDTVRNKTEWVIERAQRNNVRVVIVDGGRLQPTGEKSPLDQIDRNAVKTIEMFVGPAVVTMYGTDATNGVVVITTK